MAQSFSWRSSRRSHQYYPHQGGSAAGKNLASVTSQYRNSRCCSAPAVKASSQQCTKCSPAHVLSFTSWWHKQMWSKKKLYGNICKIFEKFTNQGMVTWLYWPNPNKRALSQQLLFRNWLMVWFQQANPCCSGCCPLQSWDLTETPEQHQWVGCCPRNCWKCFVKMISLVFPLVRQRFINYRNY